MRTWHVPALIHKLDAKSSLFGQWSRDRFVNCGVLLAEAFMLVFRDSNPREHYGSTRCYPRERATLLTAAAAYGLILLLAAYSYSPFCECREWIG